MKFLANENFPAKSILYLQQKGFDIKAVGADYPGVKDEMVMAVAISEDRTILTFDRDYGELIFRFNHKPKEGVIYLRLDRYEPDEPGMLVENLMQVKPLDFANALTVVDKKGIRQRK